MPTPQGGIKAHKLRRPNKILLPVPDANLLNIDCKSDDTLKNWPTKNINFQFQKDMFEILLFLLLSCRFIADTNTQSGPKIVDRCCTTHCHANKSVSPKMCENVSVTFHSV
jgi:hypothetical protein